MNIKSRPATLNRTDLPHQLLAWRETARRSLVYAVLLLAIPLLTSLVVRQPPAAHPWGWAVAAGLLAALAALALAGGLESRARSWLLVGLLLAFSAVGLLGLGLGGVSQYCGVLAVVFAPALLGRRAALLAFAINTVLLIVIYGAPASGFAGLWPMLVAVQPGALLIAGANILVITGMLTLVLWSLAPIVEHGLYAPASDSATARARAGAHEQSAVRDELRLSDERYRLLARNLPNTTIFLFDRDCRYTLIQGSVLDQLGYAAGHMLGKTPSDVLPPDRAEQLLPYYRAAAAGEYRSLELTRAGLVYATQFIPMADEQGAPAGGMVIAEDITARKLAETELARQLRYAEALRRCSQALLTPTANPADRRAILETALEALRQATAGSRAAIYQWLVDGERVPRHVARVVAVEPGTIAYRQLASENALVALIAEVQAPGSLPFSIATAEHLADMPHEMVDALMQGQWYGGPLAGRYPDHPRWQQLNDQNGVKSALMMPLLVKGRLGGHITLNDREQPREWDEPTIQLLRTAAEMIATALEGWEATDALRERETQIRSIGNNLPNGMIYQFVQYPDKTVAFPFLSGAIKRLTGYSADQIEAQPALLLDTIVESDAARYDAAVAESVRDLSIFEFETQRRMADGSLRWVQFCSTPRRLPDGAVVWDGIQIDITQPKEADRAAQAARARLEMLLEHTPAVIFSLRVDGDFGATFVSANVNQLTGYVPGDFTATAMFHRKLTHPQDEAYVDEAVSHLAADGHCCYEYRFLCADGVYRWMRADVRLVSDSDGRPLEAIGYWIDINERKQAELALQASEQRYRRLFEASMDAILLLDEDGVCLDANAAASELFAIPRDVLLGMDSGRLRLVDGTGGDATYARYLTSGQDRGEFAFERPDGTQRIAQYSAARIGPNLHQSILRDATEQKAVESELKRAWLAAEEATRIKSEFVAQISHEIRTPMNAVIGLTTLLLSSSLTPAQRDDVETIRRSGDALLTLIDDILDFSKIDADKLTLEYHPFSLRECVEEALDLIAPLADAKHLILRYSADTALPDEFIGDPARLRQILVNLLSNAVRFTERGAITVALSGAARAAPADGPPYWDLRIAIRDTGIGISSDELSRIFQPFTQAGPATARRYGGSGLGLTICRRLAELMLGQIEVTSSKGAGSTFTVALPAAATNAAPPAYLAPAQPALASRSALLIVDHAETGVQLARQLHGWQMAATLTTAADAPAALRDGARVDVVLIARESSVADDRPLLDLLRDVGGPALPLVLWTGVSQRGSALGEVDLGNTAVLPLPLRPSTLYKALLRLLCGEDAAFEPRAAQFDATMGQRRPLRILLAEDNATNRQVVQRLLAKLSYQADVAVNGLEVLDALKRRRYDLVLMDIQMPEMSGTEAMHYIRTFWPVEGRPYVSAITAYASDKDRAWLLTTGMDDFIRKPVRLEELVRVLTAVAARLSGGGAPGDNTAAGPSTVFDAALFADFLEIMSDGDPQADAAFVAQYVADMEAQLRQLSAVFAVQGAQATRIAHTLKGLSLQLGAMELAICCGRIEASGGSAGVDGETELLRDAERAYSALRDELVARGLVEGEGL